MNFQTASLQLSPQQAAQHLLNRRRARTDSIAYAGYIDVPLRPPSNDPDAELFAPAETNLFDHHRVLLQALDDISRINDGRLMVFMPRGSAKSTYGSIVWPSKYLGENPNRKLILASYGEELPKQHGRRVRSICRQPRFQRIFGCELARDSTAADHFRLTNGSEYYATGMEAAVVGHRAHGILMDDPVKSAKEAHSEVVRNTTHESYLYNLRPCLIPGGFVVLIMTRWDEDDIAGRILPENWNGDSGDILCRDGKVWRVLCLQARCETHTDPLGRAVGEYLCPEWFPESHWDEFKLVPQQWASMCQQLPRPPEGAFFLEKYLLVEGKPAAMPYKICLVYAVIDSATKTGKEHDGTAVGYFAVCTTGITHPLHVLDWDYQQIQGATLEQWLPSVFERLEELCVLTAARMGSAGVFIEDKASGMVLLQQAANHNERVQQRGDGMIWDAKPIDSKLTALGKKERAGNASPYVSAGEVKVTQEAYDKVVTFKGSTKNHFMSQVLRFSMDSKDDSPDDCLDVFTYGCAIGLGGRGGF